MSCKPQSLRFVHFRDQNHNHAEPGGARLQLTPRAIVKCTYFCPICSIPRPIVLLASRPARNVAERARQIYVSGQPLYKPSSIENHTHGLFLGVFQKQTASFIGAPRGRQFRPGESGSRISVVRPVQEQNRRKRSLSMEACVVI